MARGQDVNQARKAAVAGLGRELARRARSSCELCAASGVSLKVLEVAPLPSSPDADHAVMVCAECEAGVEGGKLDVFRWRFLEGVIWSETPPVQVVAVRATRRLAAAGAQWAIDLLDGLYLEPEVEAWVGEA